MCGWLLRATCVSVFWLCVPARRPARARTTGSSAVTATNCRLCRSSAWEILRALRGALTMPQASRLADLDEISVGVSHVAADFRSPIDRRRHELRPSRLPLLVAGLDVGDSQIHEH